jgi:hypothetical protein
MFRHENWQERLSNLIRQHANTPFQFGTFDCTLWCMEAIEAVTGKNCDAPYRGNYDTAIGALKILRKVGNVKTPIELMDNLLGEQKTIAFARKGDIVAFDPTDSDFAVPYDINVFGQVIGVCNGDSSYFVGKVGLIEIPTVQLGSTHHVILS